MKDLVLLHSFYHKHDAQTAVGLLEEAGIQAVLQSDDAGGFYPHLTLAAGNNRVLVRPDDAARAAEAIRPLLQDFTEGEMQAIEQMALEAEPPKDEPRRRHRRRKQGYLLAVPLFIAGMFVLSYLFQDIHANKWVTYGSANDKYTDCRTVPHLGKSYDYCRTEFYTGQLMSERMYLGGKLHGEARDYYPNGNVMWEGTYIHDQLNGASREYDYDGALRAENTYERGEIEGEYREYYRSGRLKHTGLYHGGELDGAWRTYYEDGTIAEQLTGRKGRLADQNGKYLDGSYVLRYPDGSIWEVAQYRNGRGNGYYKSYYPDGKPAITENLRDDELHGRQVYFYRNGQPFRETEYHKGNYVSERAYDEQGNLVWEDPPR